MRLKYSVVLFDFDSKKMEDAFMTVYEERAIRTRAPDGDASTADFASAGLEKI